MTSPKQAQKIAKLKEALARAAEEPSTFFDRGLEEAKIPVRQRALRLIDSRPRSRYELTQRLVQAEFDEEVVDLVVADLVRAGVVDDEAFAMQWVRERHAARGKTRTLLDQELKAKGVNADIRSLALDQISDDSEETQARRFAVKKAGTVHALPSDRQEYDKVLRRVVGVLARRGFPQSMAMRVARECLDERLDELRETLDDE